MTKPAAGGAGNGPRAAAVVTPDVRTLRPVDLTKTEFEHRALHFGAGAGLPGEKAPDSLLRAVIAQREEEMEAAIVATPATSLVVHCKGCGKRTSAECGYCVECGGKRRARREARLSRNAPPPLPQKETSVTPELAVVDAAPPRLFLKQCTVRDSETGSCCKLLAPHPGTPCRTERGEILRALQPGERPAREQLLLDAAMRSPMESDSVRASKGAAPKMLGVDDKKRAWEREKKRQQRAAGLIDGYGRLR